MPCKNKSEKKKDVRDSIFQKTRRKKLELFQLQNGNRSFSSELYISYKEEKEAGQK